MRGRLRRLSNHGRVTCDCRHLHELFWKRTLVKEQGAAWVGTKAVGSDAAKRQREQHGYQVQAVLNELVKHLWARSRRSTRGARNACQDTVTKLKT